MTFGGRSVFALVPARGGSKGIPRKNLRRVGGRSLIAHAARVAVAAPWIDSAIASTDDEEIAQEARAHGLSVPFLRPRDLASDHSDSLSVWQHAWQQLETLHGAQFDVSVLLQPTSPLRTVEDVARTVRALLDGPYLSALTVGRTPAHFSPEKLLVVGEGGAARPYTPGSSGHPLRQDIQSYSHRDGICYAATREAVMQRGEIVGDSCVAVVIERTLANIDTHEELIFVDWLVSQQVPDFHVSGVTDIPVLLAQAEERC